MGWCNLMARRYDDAIVHLKRAVELNPDYPAATHGAGVGLCAKRNACRRRTLSMKRQEVCACGKDQLLDAWLAPTMSYMTNATKG